MNAQQIFSRLILLNFVLFQSLVCGNDSQTKASQETGSTSAESSIAQQPGDPIKKADGEFQLPKRKRNEKSGSGFSLKQALGDTGLKLAIVIGILMIVVILMAKRKDRQTIPKEAIEVLGRIPYSNKQSIQLIKFGQKLVLVEASAAGLKPISEITDPAEVDQMVQMIRPSSN